MLGDGKMNAFVFAAANIGEWGPPVALTPEQAADACGETPVQWDWGGKGWAARSGVNPVLGCPNWWFKLDRFLLSFSSHR